MPQGGSLSPLLYIIFVPDLQHYLHPTIRCLLYADDVKMYGSVRIAAEMSSLQDGINGVARWCHENNMLLSVNKCAVLARKPSAGPPPSYTLNGEPLPVLPSIPDLGVAMSADLDFSTHISNIVLSARTLVNCIFRCFIIRSPEFYVRLYNSLIEPKLQYCAPIRLPHTVKHWEAIESVRKLFLRRLRWRSPQLTAPPVRPPLEHILTALDAHALKCVIIAGLCDVATNSRWSRLTVRAKAVARNDTVQNSWARRGSSKIAKNQIDSTKKVKFCGPV